MGAGGGGVFFILFRGGAGAGTDGMRGTWGGMRSEVDFCYYCLLLPLSVVYCYVLRFCCVEDGKAFIYLCASGCGVGGAGGGSLFFGLRCTGGRLLPGFLLPFVFTLDSAFTLLLGSLLVFGGPCRVQRSYSRSRIDLTDCREL